MLNARVFDGNFPFGKAMMVVDHERAAEAMLRSQLRGSLFMGLPIVAYAPAALMTNAAPTAVSQPARGVLREHMNEHVLSAAHKKPDLDVLRASCAHVLQEWSVDPKRDTMWSLRGAVTRVLAIILADVDIPKGQADTITKVYIRRFAELSVFAYFAPFMSGLLGVEEGVRRDVFLPLKRLGMSALVVDMVLFAGMFSVGTITMKCVEFATKYDIDFGALSDEKKIRFVVESIRLWPTVSTVHRIVEEPELVEVGGRTIEVQPGQEIAYPLICTNRDPTVFENPESFRLDRPPGEVAQILSWSRGDHVCPAKDISILATVMMLEALCGAAGDLRGVEIENVEV